PAGSFSPSLASRRSRLAAIDCESSRRAPGRTPTCARCGRREAHDSPRESGAEPSILLRRRVGRAPAARGVLVLHAPVHELLALGALKFLAVGAELAGFHLRLVGQGE